jgi:hypothetical protein
MKRITITAQYDDSEDETYDYDAVVDSLMQQGLESIEIHEETEED